MPEINTGNAAGPKTIAAQIGVTVVIALLAIPTIVIYAVYDVVSGLHRTLLLLGEVFQEIWA